MNELPYANAEPEAAIDDEDFQAAITDDVLAQVELPQKGRESTSQSIIQLLNVL
jgi:hypothetical protein